MKATTAIGIAAGLIFLALGATLEGTSVISFFNIPALIIVCGGTFGATMAGTSFDKIKAIPQLYVKAFKGEAPDLAGRIGQFAQMAEKARREGLLSLDSEIDKLEDPFTRKAMQLAVDGTDPDVVREIMESDTEAMSVRHHEGAATFEKASGFAPTMGILGTVMGLVAVLKNLSSPETLGPSISVAFIATLYGVGMANVIFLPVAGRLKQLSAREVELPTMSLKGVLAIQAGDNPRIIADKLGVFVAPSERQSDGDGKLPDELENLVEVQQPVAAA